MGIWGILEGLWGGGLGRVSGFDRRQDCRAEGFTSTSACVARQCPYSPGAAIGFGGLGFRIQGLGFEFILSRNSRTKACRSLAEGDWA